LLLNYVLPLALTVFFWVKYLGTPGKLLLNCHVSDATTGAPCVPVRRYCVTSPTSSRPCRCAWVFFGSLGQRKQGFHDKIAKSVVVIQDAAQTSLADLEKELR